jgi:hypothetical protein
VPALAGLTTDNSVYVAGEDGLWHHVPDVATFEALGYEWSAVTWYGDLPGTVGAPLGPASAGDSSVVAVPFAEQPVAAGAAAVPAYTGPLAGLESDRSVYLARDDQWHHIPDVATFEAMRLDWSAITWYGDLPGTAGEPLPSSAAAAPSQLTATPFGRQPQAANRPQVDTGGALAGLPDGTVYLVGDDGLWHHIPDSETFNALGLDWGSITWYGELPGSLGSEVPRSRSGVLSAGARSGPPSGEDEDVLSALFANWDIMAVDQGRTLSAALRSDDGSASWPLQVRILYAFQYLTLRGLLPVQAAAVVGNLLVESNYTLDPRTPGGGIAQWGGVRWAELLQFAHEVKHTSEYNFETQIAFIVYEFRGPESAAFRTIQGQQTVYDATYQVMKRYERPGIEHFDRRLREAQRVFDLFRAGKI